MNRYSVALLGALCIMSSGIAVGATPDLSTCDSWRPAHSTNYTNSSRPTSYPIRYVVIHKVQGSAASAASWFENSAANVSAHFTYNNTSGYCYQSVREADIGWHAGNWTYNAQGIGIEHGGWVHLNDTANVCYQESAIETRSTIIYYDVTYSRSRIVAHSEVPGASHTDPGVYWNWNYYMSYCNPNSGGGGNPTNIIDGTPAVASTWATGTSASDKYGADYKWRSTAALSDPATWTVNITAAGNYDISAWWPAGANRSTAAPFLLPGATTAVTRNQQANGGQWNLLGTRNLATGNRTTQLSCWAASGFIVVADAVKYYGPK